MAQRSSVERSALLVAGLEAFDLMRVHRADGGLRLPGLVTRRDSPAARAILERVPVAQRLAYHELLDEALLELGHVALGRARRGEPVADVDGVMLAAADPDVEAARSAAPQGCAILAVGHEQVARELTVQLRIEGGAVICERQFANRGAPRDAEEVLSRSAARLVWLDLTGSMDPGPAAVRDPETFLQRLRDDGIPVRRGFRPAGPAESDARGRGLHLHRLRG